jgi:hypothetical protein
LREVAIAMIQVARRGCPKQILEVRDIVELARESMA